MRQSRCCSSAWQPGETQSRARSAPRIGDFYDSATIRALANRRRRRISINASTASVQPLIAPPPPPPEAGGSDCAVGGAVGGGVGVELVGGAGLPATEIATLSAPIASTRPYPKVPSGATLPS